VRREERGFVRWGLVVAGIAGLIPLLYLSFLVLWGTWIAGPRPVPESRQVPALLGDAIWARAEGGTASRLRPINPVNIARLIACMALADGENDNERMSHCRDVLPALRGVEYLAALHLQEQGIQRASFRGGAGSLATSLWITRSWTRDDFLNTMAARADFGFGWRGVEAAAQGFFGRPAGELTLAEAAMIASRLAALDVDPWCDTQGAVARRDVTLRQMHANGAIDDAALGAANASELGLAQPPADRKPCHD
jgi:Transglycosylase